MDILITIGYIVVCVLLFSLAIAIHEFGHFVAALAVGLRVEKFSIGFGPAIWKKKWRGVEYRIGSIPLGGYVALPDLDPEGTKALEGGKEISSADERKVISPWKQIFVAFAGPGMNIVLAFIVAIVIAFAADVEITPKNSVVEGVLKNTPAYAAGMKEGDRILSIAGNSVKNWIDVMTETQLAGGGETEYVVMRDGKEVTIKLTPLRDDVTGMLYAGMYQHSKGPTWIAGKGVMEQISDDASRIFRVLKGLSNKKEMASTGKSLGGPVRIAEHIYSSIRKDAWDGIGFFRFLNVNLAILNLLPIPVLDGGLILFALISLLIRRPVPRKFVTVVSMFFMVVLMGLMGFLIVRDVRVSWKIHSYKAKVKAERMENAKTLSTNLVEKVVEKPETKAK
jgi:regulator of sigma E protease